MDDFITPPNHVNFLAKKLFADAGEIIDGSIAYLEKDGGGPVEPHTHQHNHLFVVVAQNNSYLVKGCRPHSIWNSSDGVTIMLGISVK